MKKIKQKKFSTLLALLLCLAIVFSIAPLAAVVDRFAEPHGDVYEVLSFEPLAGHQPVPFGTDVSGLNLPAALIATVRLVDEAQGVNLLGGISSLFSPVTAFAADISEVENGSYDNHDVIVDYNPTEPIGGDAEADIIEEDESANEPESGDENLGESENLDENGNMGENESENGNEYDNASEDEYKNENIGEDENENNNNNNNNENEDLNKNEDADDNIDNNVVESDLPPADGTLYYTTAEPQIFTTYVPVTWQVYPELDHQSGGGQALMAGMYTFTAVLGDGFVLAPGVNLPTIVVEVEPARVVAASSGVAGSIHDFFDIIESSLSVYRDGWDTVGEGTQLYIDEELRMRIEIEFDEVDADEFITNHRSAEISNRLRVTNESTTFSIPLPVRGLSLILNETSWDIDEEYTGLKIATVNYMGGSLTITFGGPFWDLDPGGWHRIVDYVYFYLEFEIDRDPNASDSNHIIELYGEDYFTVIIIGGGGATEQSELEKTFHNHDGTAPGMGIFEWELIYRPADGHAFPVDITDVFGGGNSLPHVLADTPPVFTVEWWDDIANDFVPTNLPNINEIITDSVTVAPYGRGFTFTIQDDSHPLADHEIRLRYKTVICDDRIVDWLQANIWVNDMRVSNSARLTEGGRIVGDPQYAHYVIYDEGRTLISKGGIKLTGDYSQYIQWTVRINDLSSHIGNLVLHDRLGSGLTLVRDSIVINDVHQYPWDLIDTPHRPYFDTPLTGDTTFTISFGDFPFLGDSDVNSLVITYRTRIDDDVYANLNNVAFDVISNRSWLTYTWLPGAGTDDNIDITLPGVEGYPDLNPVIIRKTFTHYEHLHYEHRTSPGTNTPPHTITWRVEINPNNFPVGIASVTDFLPVDNRFAGIRASSDAVDRDFIIMDDWEYIPLDDHISIDCHRFPGRGRITIPLHDLGTETTEFYIYTYLDNPERTHTHRPDLTINTNNIEFNGIVHGVDFTDRAEATHGEQNLAMLDKTTGYISGERVLYRGNGVFELAWNLWVNQNRMQTYFFDYFHVLDILPEHHTFVEDSLEILSTNIDPRDVSYDILDNNSISRDDRIPGRVPLNREVVMFTHEDTSFTPPSPPDPHPHDRGNNFNGRRILLQYRTRVDVFAHPELKTAFLSNTPIEFVNQAILSPLPGIYTPPVSTPNTIDPIKLLDKSADVDNEVDVRYTVNINPYTIGLEAVGKGLTLVDYLDYYLILDTESITLYEATVDELGIFDKGNPVAPQPPPTFVSRSDGEDGMGFKIVLPDDGPFILEYHATIMPGASGRLRNSIHFYGQREEDSADTEDIYVDDFYGGGGAISRSRATVLITKVDADDENTVLQGATFRVYADDIFVDGQRRFIQTQTTGVDGVVVFTGLRPNGTYRFVESYAATGYLARTLYIASSSPNITTSPVLDSDDSFIVMLNGIYGPDNLGLVMISNEAEGNGNGGNGGGENGGDNGTPPGGGENGGDNGTPPGGGENGGDNGTPPGGGENGGDNGTPPGGGENGGDNGTPPGGGNGTPPDDGENGGDNGTPPGGGENGDGNGASSDGSENGNEIPPPPSGDTETPDETPPTAVAAMHLRTPPRTGDNNFPGWWVILLFSGLIVLGSLTWRMLAKRP